jgi:hypothetical protein
MSALVRRINPCQLRGSCLSVIGHQLIENITVIVISIHPRHLQPHSLVGLVVLVSIELGTENSWTFCQS